MSFKFVDRIAARRREGAAGKNEKYLLLLKRAAFEDNLSDDEAMALADLHAELGTGLLDEIAGEVREYKELQPVAASLGKAEKEHGKGTGALESFDTDSARLLREHEAAIATREADRAKLLDANRAALAKVKTARNAGERREAIEAKHWQVLGIPDPSIARQKRQEHATAAELGRPRTIGHATRTETEPQPEFTFEKILIGEVDPASLRGLTFARMEDEPEDEFRDMVGILEQIAAGTIEPKNVRYLHKPRTLCPLIYRYRELLVNADDVLLETEMRGLPLSLSGVVWALHPGQRPSDLRSLTIAMEKAIHGHAKQVADEPDPFEALQRSNPFHA